MSTTTTTHFVGIDVSKDELVVAFSQDGKWQQHSVKNTLEAIDEWLDHLLHLLDAPIVQVILEATGPYSERLIHVLSQRQVRFSVVNPAQSRAMSKALHRTNKNDAQDARLLSLLGQKMELMPYKSRSEAQRRRIEAISALSSLQKQERQLVNQLHAFSYHVNPNTLAVGGLQRVLNSVQQEIAALEKELAPEQDEEEAKALVQKITSIPGVGLQTARAFVAYFGNFKDFESAKAFSQFLGLAPTEYSSGSSVRGRRSISKNGNSKLRSLLFNCARSAMRFNPACRNIYLRLTEKGKNGKLALTAVMHKIARLIFGVARSNSIFDPNFKTFCA